MPDEVPFRDQPVPPWPSRPLVEDPIAADARVLLVSAHPDDETIGAGRLVAEHGAHVRAVTLSGGERCFGGAAADEVARRRLGEWRSAMARLGAEPLETQRWPDGDLGRHEAAIGDHLLDLAEQVDAVLVTWRHDPHPDHRAAGRAAASAAARRRVPLVEYPVWAPYWTTLAEVEASGSRIVAIASSTPADDARELALEGYASQTTPHRPGADPVVPREMLQRHGVQLLVRTP